jgi:protein-tyrosine phosphatase
MPPADDRAIAFERWWNVRDLGDLPTGDGGITRSGVLVRAASPEFATPADITRAGRLGLRSFVDLRVPGHATDWRAATPGVATVSVDLVGGLDRPREAPAPDLLRLMLDAGRAQVARAIGTITHLAAESPPVVFHCHTGKDRTGLIAIVLLSLAGVPEEAIIADYLASNPGFVEMRQALAGDSGMGFMAGAPTAFRGPVSRPAAEAGLRFLREAGGATAYLASAGLDPDEIRLAAALLRPAALAG